jgi:hypothetical protein
MDAGAALLIFGVIVFLISIFRKHFEALWDWISDQNTFGKMVDEGKLK